MCGDLLKTWLALVVCVCGMAAAGEPYEPVAEPNKSWITAEHLAPGLEVLVERAVAEGEKYEYCTKTRYDPNEVQYLLVGKDGSRPRSPTAPGNDSYSWPDGILPEIIITEIDVIDVEGNSIRRGSEGMTLSGDNFAASDYPRIVTRTYSSRCPDCAEAAFIRYVLAFKPYSRQVQFVLENVPVPTE